MLTALLANEVRFMRHGRTAANAAGLICGQTDLPLDAVGRDQVRRTAAHLDGWPVASIWTSALSRAQASAAAVAAVTGAQVHTLAALGERDWGAWEGQPRERLVREATPPGGEGPEAFRDRVLGGLALVTGPFPVLVVAHSGTARVIHAALCATPFPALGNAEVVDWRRGVRGWDRHTIVKEGC